MKIFHKYHPLAYLLSSTEKPQGKLAMLCNESRPKEKHDVSWFLLELSVCYVYVYTCSLNRAR